MKVELNKEIAERLQNRVDETDEFKSVEEYVNNILSQVVERLDEESGSSKGDEEVYSEEDEEKVKERLKSLGYLD